VAETMIMAAMDFMDTRRIAKRMEIGAEMVELIDIAKNLLSDRDAESEERFVSSEIFNPVEGLLFYTARIDGANPEAPVDGAFPG